MTLQASGTITMAQVNTELSLASTAYITLNDALVRTMLVKPSGLIALADAYGKTKPITNFVFNPVIAATTTNYNLRAAAVAAGWNQTSPLQATVTINSGVVLGSTTNATYAFETGVTFPAGTTLALVNNGYIVGKGGNANGGAGGPALRAQQAISITNNGTIGGGGGGGGYGAYGYGQVVSGKTTYTGYSGGGGGGGGAGYGGLGGGVNGANSGSVGYSGRAGGTDSPFAGAGGTTTAGGAVGGTSGWGGICYVLSYSNPYVLYGGNGGNGGGLGANGANGAGLSQGGALTTVVTVTALSGGGAAGAAVAGNSLITWTVTGTRLGAIA